MVISQIEKKQISIKNSIPEDFAKDIENYTMKMGKCIFFVLLSFRILTYIELILGHFVNIISFSQAYNNNNCSLFFKMIFKLLQIDFTTAIIDIFLILFIILLILSKKIEKLSSIMRSYHIKLIVYLIFLIPFFLSYVCSLHLIFRDDKYLSGLPKEKVTIIYLLVQVPIRFMIYIVYILTGFLLLVVINIYSNYLKFFNKQLHIKYDIYKHKNMYGFKIYNTDPERKDNEPASSNIAWMLNIVDFKDNNQDSELPVEDSNKYKVLVLRNDENVEEECRKFIEHNKQYPNATYEKCMNTDKDVLKEAFDNIKSVFADIKKQNLLKKDIFNNIMNFIMYTEESQNLEAFKKVYYYYTNKKKRELNEIMNNHNV